MGHLESLSSLQPHKSYPGFDMHVVRLSVLKPSSSTLQCVKLQIQSQNKPGFQFYGSWPVPKSFEGWGFNLLPSLLNRPTINTPKPVIDYIQCTAFAIGDCSLATLFTLCLLLWNVSDWRSTGVEMGLFVLSLLLDRGSGCAGNTISALFFSSLHSLASDQILICVKSEFQFSFMVSYKVSIATLF